MTLPISELIEIEHVEGAVFLSENGMVIQRHLVPELDSEVADKDWRAAAGSGTGWEAIANVFSGIREAEMVFEHRRIYCRSLADGYLIVVMKEDASSEMVRLSVDALIAEDGRGRKRKGFARIFRMGE